MTDRTITLITGANKGLGYETTRRVIEAGHTVYIGARDAERGQAAADALGAQFVRVDVTNDASVDDVAAELFRTDGCGLEGPPQETSPWQRYIYLYYRRRKSLSSKLGRKVWTQIGTEDVSMPASVRT